MNGITRINQSVRRLVLSTAWLSLSLALIPCIQATADDSASSRDSMLFQSAESSRVLEKVRAASPGVIVELFVKPGDIVKKGQLLGQLDLDATKLQFQLAKAALDAKSNVEAAEGQAEAWSIARKETEDAIRKRRAEKSRLEWATAMEKMYRGTYEVQLDAEKTQQIQYDYWKDQYEKRFFRAPIDGVVTEVLSDIGKPVTIAAHVFTIRNDNVIAIPVTIPASIASEAQPGDTIPVRLVNSKLSSRAVIDRLTDLPNQTGDKSVRLLLPSTDVSTANRMKLIGMKFEVLFPLGARS